MRRHIMFAAAVMALGWTVTPASADDIISEWSTVKAPAAPALKAVTLEPKTTALLMLDFLKPNCGVRPHCMASLPAAKQLLGAARAAKATVIYSYFGKFTAADIVEPDLAPLPGEASVTSFADKFLNTDLDKLLHDKGITTVIVAGTSSNGAILYTGTGAALRGYNVVVPVDAVSSADSYSEQFSLWQLANGPTFGQKVSISRTSMIHF